MQDQEDAYTIFGWSKTVEVTQWPLGFGFNFIPLQLGLRSQETALFPQSLGNGFCPF